MNENALFSLSVDFNLDLADNVVWQRSKNPNLFV